jgi:DNA-binding NarL/FixJ family response regulator
VSPTTRVLLVEDNDVYRASLELLLGMQEGIEVAGLAATGREAVERVAESGADVVLMDFRLPGLDGAAATRAVLEVAPRVAVICLTAEATPVEREDVLAAGAVALVEKGAPVEALVEAIRTRGRAET